MNFDRCFIRIFFLLLFAESFLFAAEKKSPSVIFGIQGGVHFEGLRDYAPQDTLDFQSITPQLSIGSNFGFLANIALYQNFHAIFGIRRTVIRPEWTITRNILQKTPEGFRNLTNPENAIRTITYNEIPMGVKYRTEHFYLFATYNFAFVDTVYATDNCDGIENRYALTSHFDKRFQSAEIGAGLVVNRQDAYNSWIFEIAYNYGFSNLLKRDEKYFRDLRPGGIKIQIGYEIDFSKYLNQSRMP